MTVSFNLPDNIENQLRAELGDLNQAAKEAALVELYRLGKLSHGKLAESLGVSRFETDALLKQHNVTEDLVTVDEFNEQVDGLHKILGE